MNKRARTRLGAVLTPFSALLVLALAASADESRSGDDPLGFYCNADTLPIALEGYGNGGPQYGGSTQKAGP